MNTTKLPKRKSIRLPDYDYTSSGYYFATVVVQNREMLFGDIVDGEMIVNNAGKIVEVVWKSLPERFDIELDTFQIMPNHIHCIIAIVGNGLPSESEGTPTTLGKIIAYFKYQSTKQINIILHQPPQPIWQRNYYEHVIRNDRDLMEIQQYILDNPMGWELDDENPNKKKLNILHP